MAAVVADTHTAVWYFLTDPRLSAGAKTALDTATAFGDPIFVSSISVVEVTYLVEKSRLPALALERLTAALNDPLSGFVVAGLDLAVAMAVRQIPRNVLPDLPDRVIAATALQLNLPLVTRDRRMRAASIETIRSAIYSRSQNRKIDTARPTLQ